MASQGPGAPRHALWPARAQEHHSTPCGQAGYVWRGSSRGDMLLVLEGGQDAAVGDLQVGEKKQLWGGE